MRSVTFVVVSLAGWVCVGLLAGRATAQLDFGLSYPTGESWGARSPVVADVDGDGDLDLVVGTDRLDPAVHERILWYANDGAATGWEPHLVTDGGGGTSVAVGDIDLDGDADIVAGSLESGRVLRFQNLDGQGETWLDEVLVEFVFPQQHAAITSVDLADVDTDGDLDVLFTGSYVEQFDTKQRTWWIEQFAFGMGAPVEVNALGDADAVLAADLDGDGDLDVLSTGATSACGWQRNVNGLGAWGSFQPIWNLGAHAAVVADVDQDGDLDVLATREERVRWEQNVDGLGDFQPLQDLVVPGTFLHFDARAGDVDQDGDVDTLVLASGALHLFPHLDAQAGFGAAQTFADMPAPGIQAGSGLAAGDLDGDGDVDAAVTERSPFSTSWSVAWVENEAALGAPHVIGHNPSGAPRMVIDDLDADGDPDVLLATGVGPIQWLQNAAGQLVPPVTLVDGTDAFAQLLVADLDGDGDGDLVAAQGDVHPGPPRFDWFAQAAGGFGAAVAIPTASDGAAGLGALDVDGDGDLDLVSLDVQGDLVRHDNLDGLGAFAAPVVIDAHASPMTSLALDVADFDGDGHDDVLASRWFFGGPGHVVWYAAAGDGSFAPADVIDAGGALPVEVQAADVDGDGDPDVVAANQSDASPVSWFENTDGAGSFGFPRPVWQAALDVQIPTTRVTVADLDGDGDLDMAASAQLDTGTPVVWLENLDGLGDFGDAHVVHAPPDEPRDLAALDVDGDGDMDLLAREYGELALFTNRGPWVDLGQPLGGAWGEPDFVADGSLVGGEPFSFALTRGRPGSTAALVLGLVEWSAPFKGGTLVPAPSLVLAGLPVGLDGALTFDVPMPAGVAPDTTLYVQFWIADPDAVAGFAASNGRLGVTP